MICSTLASVWKFQYCRRLMYNPVKHIWWNFYRENTKPLSIFTKSSIVDAWLGSKYASAFSKTLQTFSFFKVFDIIKLLKSVISLKELRNCVLYFIRAGSLFCSVRICISLHFLPILLVKLGFRLTVF